MGLGRERRSRDAGVPPLAARGTKGFLFFFFLDCSWATLRAPSAVREGKHAEAAERELHAGCGERWARS